jgi:hypothetical protein
VPTILQRSGSALAEGTRLHYAVVFFVVAIITFLVGRPRVQRLTS